MSQTGEGEYSSGAVGRQDDDRFDRIEITRFGDPGPVYTQGKCKHRCPVPVYAWPTEELVAWLCTDCDTQLEAE